MTRSLVSLAVVWGLALGAACREPGASSAPVVEQESETPVDGGAVDRSSEPTTTEVTPEVAIPEPAAVEPPVVDDGPLAPLDPSAREALAAIRPDPPPKKLVRDTHYWISNEQSHFLWHDAVAGKGGAYLGVATDQNYMIAAWARSELLVLMDFDAGVVDLHRVYGVLFSRAESPQQLLELWSEAREPDVERWIEEELPADQREGAVEALHSARAKVEERLQAVDAQYRERGLPTFLSDQEQYDHLRTLWRNGRVVAVRGDLTAEQTMVDIAKALETVGIPIGVLYLSNAEQYFKYRAGYRRNISALPMADDGVVLRTHGWIQFGYVKDEDYHYNRQPAPLFSEWMKRGRAWGVPAMLEHRSKTKTRGYSVLDKPPPRRGKSSG